MPSKFKLIELIQQINRSARAEWLSRFDESALVLYLDNLQRAQAAATEHQRQVDGMNAELAGQAKLVSFLGGDSELFFCRDPLCNARRNQAKEDRVHAILDGVVCALV